MLPSVGVLSNLSVAKRAINSGLKLKLSVPKKSLVINAKASFCLAALTGSKTGLPEPARSRRMLTPPMYLAAKGATRFS